MMRPTCVALLMSLWINKNSTEIRSMTMCEESDLQVSEHTCEFCVDALLSPSVCILSR